MKAREALARSNRCHTVTCGNSKLDLETWRPVMHWNDNQQALRSGKGLASVSKKELLSLKLFTSIRL
jgi:hypothetical protein